MRIATGRVVDGKIVVEGAPFDLVPEQKEELLEAIREADEGLGRDGWEFLRELGGKK